MRSNVTEVREVGPFERMLTVTIDADALKAGRRSAAARLSKSTKIKGFRPGKAPVQVVESVVGTEALDREAVDEALPKALAAALAESELRPIVYPRLTDIRSLESGTEVDVLITLWPKVDRLPEYRGRKVAVERPTVSDTDVDEQVERMREQFAELEEVGREGFDGDFVLVDVQTTVDGAELSEGSTKDLMYEIGSGSLFDGMDDALRGTGRVASSSSRPRCPKPWAATRARRPGFGFSSNASTPSVSRTDRRVGGRRVRVRDHRRDARAGRCGDAADLRPQLVGAPRAADDCRPGRGPRPGSSRGAGLCGDGDGSPSVRTPARAAGSHRRAIPAAHGTGRRAILGRSSLPGRGEPAH
jgi:hypothetical protein